MNRKARRGRRARPMDLLHEAYQSAIARFLFLGWSAERIARRLLFRETSALPDLNARGYGVLREVSARAVQGPGSQDRQPAPGGGGPAREAPPPQKLEGEKRGHFENPRHECSGAPAHGLPAPRGSAPTQSHRPRSDSSADG